MCSFLFFPLCCPYSRSLYYNSSSNSSYYLFLCSIFCVCAWRQCWAAHAYAREGQMVFSCCCWRQNDKRKRERESQRECECKRRRLCSCYSSLSFSFDFSFSSISIFWSVIRWKQLPGYVLNAYEQYAFINEIEVLCECLVCFVRFSVSQRRRHCPPFLFSYSKPMIAITRQAHSFADDGRFYMCIFSQPKNNRSTT